MSSFPSSSHQRAWTAGSCVKNRCPPISKRNPLYSTVRARPPTVLSASSTVTWWPLPARRYAAVRPAGPAPQITTRSSGWRRAVWRGDITRCAFIATLPFASFGLVEGLRAGRSTTEVSRTCPDPSPELADVARLESDWDRRQPLPKAKRRLGRKGSARRWLGSRNADSAPPLVIPGGPADALLPRQDRLLTRAVRGRPSIRGATGSFGGS